METEKYFYRFGYFDYESGRFEVVLTYDKKLTEIQYKSLVRDAYIEAYATVNGSSEPDGIICQVYALFHESLNQMKKVGFKTIQTESAYIVTGDAHFHDV